ncbi:dihydrodipicolinate synthase family protein [Lacticaseibacillus nasuensis]|uniref:dihydrodipicolinate synthase family protein n=1 Tax=Lacticaseibacillus nasuensis TaxID=944671 RepID=UPI0022473C04|nr:dihydrodipicolinate synthase family protein [Lacticaseibacillus nasuensis]MCX2454950.1 dihydrodipicolinate synthase family protein [Lacticaseibacillus nasuensis]
MTPFSGILVAMVTPFDDDENVSLPRTKQLIEYLLQFDIAGLFILGTNGEAYTMTEEEKFRFAESVIQVVAGRTKVIVGTGLNSTKETITFSQRIAQLQPDAISLVSPSFVAPSQTELIAHYQAIADAVSVPCILYNMPAKTGINIDPSSIKILSQHPNIIGVKDSSGDWANFNGYLANRNQADFTVIMGSDSKILEALKHGGDAAITGTGNLLTADAVNIYQAFQAGAYEAAKQYQAQVELLRAVLHEATIPVSLKAALTAAGINVGPARRPALMPAPGSKLAADITRVVADYRAQGII